MGTGRKYMYREEVHVGVDLLCVTIPKNTYLPFIKFKIYPRRGDVLPEGSCLLVSTSVWYKKLSSVYVVTLCFTFPTPTMFS